MSQRVKAEHSSTYHEAKREHVGGLVDAAFGMSFRIAPILVAHLSSPNIAAGWNVGGVFEIAETDLINEDCMTGLAPLDQDIVRFNVYGVLAVFIEDAGRMVEIGLTSMHNVLMVQLSKTLQCIFQNPLGE